MIVGIEGDGCENIAKSKNQYFLQLQYTRILGVWELGMKWMVGLCFVLEALVLDSLSLSHRTLRPSLPLGGELCWKEELPLLLPLHPVSLPPHDLCLRLQHRLCGPQ